MKKRKYLKKLEEEIELLKSWINEPNVVPSNPLSEKIKKRIKEIETFIEKGVIIKECHYNIVPPFGKCIDGSFRCKKGKYCDYYI